LLKHPRGKALRSDLQMATSSRLLVKQWVCSPGGISCYLLSGFTSSTARLVHNNIISKDVCRVFVLRCQSAFHLTCLVSFHQIHLSQSSLYTHYIHSTIHTFTHYYFHSYTTSFIHGRIYHNVDNQFQFQFQVQKCHPQRWLFQ
jgi:hypothetical protein